ncbi:MAG: hypothetical protein ACTHJ5_18515 [Ilyomonas sp.]
MKNLKLLLALISVFLIVITGCKKDIRQEQRTDSVEVESSLKKFSPKQLHQIVTSLPEGSEKRFRKNLDRFLELHPEYRQAVLRALKVSDASTCNENTDINLWLDQQLSDWNDDVILLAIYTGMLDFPTYDALFFENSSSDQQFGVNGEFSQRAEKTFKDLKRFWDIQTNNLVLGAMHGSMLMDKERVIRIDKILYGDSQADAEYWADLIVELMNNVPQYRHGDHPIFTFNAFAQSGFNFPPYGAIPPKIILGDGILEGLAAIGYKDVSTQAVLAHEFGHHIQFQLGLYGNEVTPEATRKNELMADAFSAYYLSHARGASMQWKRVKQFLQVFFNIGDCQFNDVGHHGTPAQRMAAAEWAYSVADNAQKQGHILSSRQFVQLFEAAYPSILAHK